MLLTSMQRGCGTRRRPVPRKRIHQHYAVKVPPEKVGALINRVRRAFRALVPEPLDKTALEKLDKAVAREAHLLVQGLSGATARPPAQFLVDGKRHTPLKRDPARRGRDPEIEGDLIAAVCLQRYEAFTGQRATGYDDGPYVQLVAAVFAAFGMKAKSIARVNETISFRKRDRGNCLPKKS
jgi:hypothetical protein